MPINHFVDNPRDAAIDFTKGILVVFMVIYHTLNAYGIYPQKYLTFVPASFIMISGFIITHIYYPRYGADIGILRTKLAIRSAKLLLIFTVLNVLILFIFPYRQGNSFELGDSWERWAAIYLLGSPGMVAFDVLVPISYTLLLPIVVSPFRLVKPCLINLLALIVPGLCLAMETHGNSVYNINLISAGLLGMAMGLTSVSLINKLIGSRTLLLFLSLLSILGFFILSGRYINQIGLTAIGLYLLYTIGRRIDLRHWTFKQAMLLGQYSLLSYIVQIAFLQLYKMTIARLHIGEPIIVTMIGITLITLLTVSLLDQARRKYSPVNFLYHKVFA